MKHDFYSYNFNFFNFSIYIIWGITFFTLLGINYIAPKYIDLFTYIVRLYVCFFLIFRFNPLYNIKLKSTFTKLDKKVAFSAAMIILTTDSSFIGFVESIISNVKKIRF